MRTHKRKLTGTVVAAAALLLFLALPGGAWARTLNDLTITSDMTGGATTAPTSGVSIMYVNKTSTTSISAVVDGPCRTVQVKEIDYSQAQQALGGTVDGTFSLWAVQSLDENDFASGETVYFYKDEELTSLTNNTVAPVTRRLQPGMFLQYYFGTSGATGFDKAHIVERGGEQTGEYYVSPAVVFDEQHSAFSTSGVSNDMTSGGTGFTLPDGANWFGFFANGDDVPYSTDDTDASTSGLYFPESEQKILPLGEVRNLGTAANGSSAGTLTMTPYSHRPY
jgi:hypothetical protein